MTPYTYDYKEGLIFLQAITLSEFKTFLQKSPY